MRSNRRLIGWALPVIALLAVAGAAVSIARNAPDRPLVEPRMAAPSPPPALAGRPAGVIGAVGIVESASEELDLASHRNGVIERVLVEPGQQVREGDLLWTLDRRDAAAALAMAEAELARANGEVAAAAARLADVQDQLARAERLTVGTSISEDTLARRRFAQRTATAELEVARLAVDTARAARDAAAVELALREVRAPVDATVLQVNLQVGEYAEAKRAETAGVVLGALQPLHVRAEIDETDVPRFHADAAAWAALRGAAEHRVLLRLVRVEPLVMPKRTLTGSSTERIDTRVLRVVYAFDPAELAAFPGQQVDLFIGTGPGDRPADGPPVSLLTP